MNTRTNKKSTLFGVLFLLISIPDSNPFECGSPADFRQTPAGRRLLLGVFESCHSDHNWTPVLIQCVSKRVSSFFLQKSLFARVFIYFLTITGSAVVLKWSLWNLFRFTPLYHLTKGLLGVHFEPRGVHLLIIPRQRKKPEQLRSDLDFRAILENECDLSILVNNGLFNHHRPDGVVPVMHHFRLFLEATNIKCHLFVLLALGGAYALQPLQFRSRLPFPAAAFRR